MIPLNQIRVPTPCAANWDAMDGNARRRLCAGCGCHVHDLSAMTRRDAQDLLDKAEGRVCVRFQTRADGSVLTQDSPAEPVLERRVVWPRRLAAAASWAVALTLTGLGLTARAETVQKNTSAKAKPHVAAPAAKRPPMVLGRIGMPHLKPQATQGNVVTQPTVGQPTMGKPVPPPLPSHTMGIVALPMTPHHTPKK